LETIITAGPTPGRGFREAASDGETRRSALPCSPALALSPSLRVQAYIRMFLLRELASPVGNATGMREEKDTWREEGEQ